jgi:cytochrome d ubiquinol oxidase subunit I
VLTAAQASSQVPASHIALTLALYLSTYAMLLFAYVRVVFHLARKAALAGMGQGVDGMEAAPPAAITQAGVAHA